ncbi:unnamed protein product, partial [Musa textilis]
GVFIDPKWIQNWAPNLKSIWSSQVSGGQGGATACVSRLTDVQGRCYRSSLVTGAVPPPQPGGSTACLCTGA